MEYSYFAQNNNTKQPDFLFRDVNTGNTYFNNDNNSDLGGPIIDFINYGYASLDFEKNNNIIEYKIPTDNDKHKLVNSIDINWCKAEINVEINNEITNQYIIETTDDLINFINDSYNYPAIDLSQFISDNNIDEKIKSVYGENKSFSEISAECENIINLVEDITNGTTTYDPMPIEQIEE